MRLGRSLRGRAAALVVALSLAAPDARADAPAPEPEPAPADAPDEGILEEVPTDVLMVLPIESWGAIEDHIPAALVTRIEDGLRRGNFTVISAEAVGAPIPTGECDAACVKGVVAGTEATHLVRASVVVEGRDYNVRVDLFRGDTGELVATSDDVCEICGHEELADLVGDLAAALRRKLSAAIDPPPLLRVLVQPEGSLVMVDGEVVGVTPVEVTVAPGEHDVVVQRPGFVAHRARLAFIDGVTETIKTQLAAAPVLEGDEEKPDPAGRRPSPLGWIALGVGVGVTGGGVALLALDERPIGRLCTADNIDALGNCKWRYNTLAGGITMTVAGVAALALGAVLVARERKRSRRDRSPVAVLVDGAGVGLRF